MEDRKLQEDVDNIVLDIINISKNREYVHTLFMCINDKNGMSAKHMDLSTDALYAMLFELVRSDRDLMIPAIASLLALFKYNIRLKNIDEINLDLIFIKYVMSELESICKDSEKALKDHIIENI